MKILVTGSAGFIGSHTATAVLRRGDEVVGLDDFNDFYSPEVKEWNVHEIENEFPRSFRMVRGDIRDESLVPDLFQKEKFDKVCHLAARAGVRPSIADPRLYHEVNVMGTLNLLEASRRFGVKNFVFASSSSVYGECRESLFREDLKLDRPISPYAATKKANENLAYTYSHLFGLPTIGLRFFTVYGPSGRPDMAPFLFTKWISEETPVRRFGDGTSSRDYTFVDDIVSGVLSAIDLDAKHEIFNLGNSDPHELRELIAIVEEILGKKAVTQEFPHQPGDVSRTAADISHAQKLLGYSPKVSLRNGMEGFISWYLEHRELYRK